MDKYNFEFSMRKHDGDGATHLVVVVNATNYPEAQKKARALVKDLEITKFTLGAIRPVNS